MATLAVAAVNLFAFWNGVCWFCGHLVVTVATAASASLEILDVVQLILHAVAFPYIPDKRVTTP
jgi:hypothetical protein